MSESTLGLAFALAFALAFVCFVDDFFDCEPVVMVAVTLLLAACMWSKFDVGAFGGGNRRLM